METITQQQSYIDTEKEFGAHDYHPIPVVLEKGEGVFLWDVNGKRYYDFLSAYSAVNQGHCHPKIVSALQQQAAQLTLTSRAFHNDKLGSYMQYATSYFGFERLLPSNTGAEAVEAAIKITRKWGYTVKGIPNNQAEIVVCQQNFHGRTSTIVSFSSDPEARNYFGPASPGFISIPYDDLEALEKVFSERPQIAGFLVEPIQGEAGVYTPSDDFIKRARALCTQYNVLFVVDEIQTGIGRTGSLLAVCGNCSCQGHCEKQTETYTQPDILILGKALSGGAYPISAVLTRSDIIDVIQPGQHGSTFGGNPMACSIAMTALEVIQEEKLTQNARSLGARFRLAMQEYIATSKTVLKVRGKGLLNAIVINDSETGQMAWNICLRLRDHGLLAKPTHGNIIRFAPPLVMTSEQLEDCIAIIVKTLREFEP
ncbi:MAG: ornithine--oxo-acid transaminase [Flavobacteriaceae bacterium]